MERWRIVSVLIGLVLAIPVGHLLFSGADLSIGASSPLMAPGLAGIEREAPDLTGDEAARRADRSRRPALRGAEIERLLRGRYATVETIGLSESLRTRRSSTSSCPMEPTSSGSPAEWARVIPSASASA